ncbi:hypothetical protein WJX84_009105 [Apatococcus fuscideae]|uniref:Uncharacterized protein n=1 Tax=Apatococcus fuscideae TaxID=2026836 RepID=A0AAW1THL4_9CHLO
MLRQLAQELGAKARAERLDAAVLAQSNELPPGKSTTAKSGCLTIRAQLGGSGLQLLPAFSKLSGFDQVGPRREHSGDQPGIPWAAKAALVRAVLRHDIIHLAKDGT